MKLINTLFALAAVSLPLLAQRPPAEDFPITAAERNTVIENSIKRLNERYVFPDVAKKMEQALRSRVAKGEYSNITSSKIFAEKLTADLREVSHDKHLTVFGSSSVIPDRAPDSEPSAADLAEQRAFLAQRNFGFEKVERLQGNVGYVDIRGFVPPTLGADTASAAMNFVANSDALIVDLRKNGGGDPAMIAFVLSYLFDQPTHLNDIYTRFNDSTRQYWTTEHVAGQRFGGKKPVYVLTSNYTFSGGEELTYNLKSLKRATILGETTGGGAHPVGPVKVSDHFQIGVPFARAINPITKTNWEGVGVSPDISMPADQAFDAAYKMALQKVAESADPQRKAQLEKLIAEKK